MSENKRIIPLDKLIDYPEHRYKAAVLAIKALRGVVDQGKYNEMETSYNKIAGYALKKVLEGEVEEVEDSQEEVEE